MGTVYFQLAGTSLPSLCASDPCAGTREMCDHNTGGHKSHLPGALGCLDQFTESLVISQREPAL